MGCCIMKGVSEQCMVRLHLTLENRQKSNETATWPHVYQKGPPSWGASNVMGASQGVSPLPNLHNLHQ